MDTQIEKKEEENENLTPATPMKAGEISHTSIIDEMKANYLDYSMSVIVSRALPEVKDGLKPSQRRILVAMNDLALTPKAHYRKSAKISGDTSGNYHPHGESVIYPTLVKMAQDFSTRYPLIDGQGNFGSIDGDSAAAMRYTEARMGKITPELIKDLNKGTVTFIQNYDGTRLEPTVLPALFPNVLANGSDGIAVGMATKIPPHNLTELITALQKMISLGNKWEGNAVYNELRKNKESKEITPTLLNSKPLDYLENYVEHNNLPLQNNIELLRKKLIDEEQTLYPEFKSDITPLDLIEIIPGPDFPTGGIIYDQKEILNAYATGRGRILQRAFNQEPQDVMTLRMIYGLDGRKMSTSWGNVINILDNPIDMFGKLMTLKDELIIDYFESCTRIPMIQIEEIRKSLKNKEINPKDIKKQLAKEIVTIFHNAKEAQRAQEEFEQVFEDKKLPTEIEEVEIENGEHNTQELLVKLSLAKSKSEAKRLIDQGGVKIIINNTTEIIKVDTIKTEKEMIIQVGKRNFKKIV